MAPSPSADGALAADDASLLLDIADAAIVEGLVGGPPSAPPLALLPAALRQHVGVFVTLTVDGDLNGCIGTIEGEEPLGHGTARHAWSAAFADPRLPALARPTTSGSRPRCRCSRRSRPLRLGHVSVFSSSSGPAPTGSSSHSAPAEGCSSRRCGTSSGTPRRSSTTFRSKLGFRPAGGMAPSERGGSARPSSPGDRASSRTRRRRPERPSHLLRTPPPDGFDSG